MQIELTGCTNAGKSTLAADIRRSCREQGIDILLGEEFVLAQYRLNWVKNRLARRLLLNLAGLLASLTSWRRHRQFYLFAIQVLFQLPISSVERFGLLRNILKRTGVCEIIRSRKTGQQVILVDEGPLQAAHNLFVHVSAEAAPGDLVAFAGLVPLSDVVVYLKQPEGLLIDRTMKRGHKRIPDGSYGKVARFIKRATAVFDELVQQPAVKNRVLVVDGTQKVAAGIGDQNGRTMDLAASIIGSGFGRDRDRQPSDMIYVE